MQIIWLMGRHIKPSWLVIGPVLRAIHFICLTEMLEQEIHLVPICQKADI